MANNQVPSMASLEITMWRPTPQKPDVPNGSPNAAEADYWRPTPQKPDAVTDEPGKSNGFTAAEKINKMFEIVSSSNGALQAPQFKATIETAIETKAALSAQIILWRPTPQKPDVAKKPGTGVMLEPFNAYLLLEDEQNWKDVEWAADNEAEPKPKHVRSIKITKGQRINGKRALDLTVTFQPPIGNGSTDKDKKNKPSGNVEAD